MSELNDVDILSQITKKIDDQARFTRMLVVVCCLAVVGSMFYSLSSLIAVIPELVLAKILGNVENIHAEWKTIDKLNNQNHKNKKESQTQTQEPAE